VPQRYVSDVLDDFSDLAKLGLTYQPWVQFSEPYFSGKLVYIDIDKRGFPIRKIINPYISSQSHVVNILILDGSTTFGYNVSDEHTWPSYLSKVLN
jgi:hypothetical protein